MKDENNTEESKGNGLVKKAGLVFVILLLGSSVAFFLNLNDEAGDELIKDPTLGERLDDAGWMLYTMNGCGWCEKQKEVLGYDKFDIKIENCATRDECTENALAINTTGFPSWHNVFSNETLPGFRTLEQLEEMCK